MTASVPRGLYAVTSQKLCASPEALFVAAEAALAGGAVMLQYRDKHSDPERKGALAAGLATRCRAAGARFIVNDDITLAAVCGADGVHLGRTDGTVAEARARLGAGAIVGVSCGPSLERVRQAADDGASYAAIGRFYPSTTKADAPGATIDDLRAARAAVALPLCAIGGIRPEHVPTLVAAGADLVAVVAGLFEAADDVQAQARAYAAGFGPGRGR